MTKARRPASIRWFERLIYLGLALAALNGSVVAGNPGARAELGEDGLAFSVLLLVLTVTFNLLFLWLIAYRASNLARWIFLGLVAIAATFVLADARLVADLRHQRDYRDLSDALTLAQYLLCLIESGLLFLPDGRDWFAGRAPLDP